MNDLGKTNTGIKYSAVIALSAIAAFVFYWLTCFRTFTWWDSSEYSVAALTLGVPHPPGSLLTVISGWVVAKLPLGIDKFFALNLLSALMAAITVYLVGRTALGLFFQTDENGNSQTAGYRYGPAVGISLGVLFFGLSATMWYYAIRFTPYMTTALLTALIIMAALGWQRHASDPKSHVWLALTMFLFGLDFSIHRTNLLMLPGFLIWIAIVRPKTFVSIRHWLYGILGLAAGLSIQLLVIPIAAGQPFINFNDPSALSRFWDYITLKQYGGGWLINMFPRHAPFIAAQVVDYIKDFSDNFIVGSWPVVRYLPLVMGIAGAILLFRRNWKLSMGLAILFLFSSLGAVIYFNMPENFFRSIDRHYMPSFVIFGLFIAYGAAGLIRAAFSAGRGYRGAIIAAATILLALMPLQAALRNYGNFDGSKSYFAYDTAKNYLANLPQGAIIFTQADIDTYTLWCLQAGENFRPDVTVCNLSLMNTPWFVRQIIEKDMEFPARLGQGEIDSLTIIPWHDSTITLPAKIDQADIDTYSGTSIPDSIKLTLKPTINDQYIYVHDQMLLKTISGNRWRRPIYFSSLLPESSISWLLPYLHQEGLARRLAPVKAESEERAGLRENLLENYSYRGFSDPAIPKEDPTKWIGWNLCGAFMTLAAMEYAAGDTAACRNAADQLRLLIAPEYLSPPPNLQNAIENACR